MKRISKSDFATLVTLCYMLVGCGVDERALSNILNLPEGFTVEEFQSAKDRSAMHGPSYFSFKGKEGDFEEISRLNDLVKVTKYPDSIDVKWRSHVVNLLNSDRLQNWPSEKKIVEHHLFTNIGKLPPEPYDNSIAKFAVHVENTIFMVVHPIY